MKINLKSSFLNLPNFYSSVGTSENDEPVVAVQRPDGRGGGNRRRVFSDQIVRRRVRSDESAEVERITSDSVRHPRFAERRKVCVYLRRKFGRNLRRKVCVNLMGKFLADFETVFAARISLSRAINVTEISGTKINFIFGIVFV